MVRSKGPLKKQRGGGVDFKKFKRKVGKKLPPPKNATNVEIKSKAIILPEQSVASDKAGLAVSKKGLTLKELLQQTSHHNVKVRKDALIGIKELLLKYPTELKLHKLAIIEKLRERINDDDKVVRDTLHQLFKSVIFPGCKDDNQGALISLVMAYIFNAMTHLSVDVRLMAFKFLGLVVDSYSPAFSSYADKVLESYIEILQKSQFHVEDKNKVKIILLGLANCLSLLPSTEKEVRSRGKDNAEKEVLHGFDAVACQDASGHISITAKLKDLVRVLVNYFDGFISQSRSQLMLDSQSFECLRYILRSIDCVVQYRLYEIGSSENCSLNEKLRTLSLEKLFIGFPLHSICHLSDDGQYFIVNAVICRIFFTYSQWISPAPDLLNGFLKFLIDMLFEVYSGEQSYKAFYEEHLASLIPFIPKLASTVDWSWRRPLLQAFTLTFGRCGPVSAMKMACLKAVEEMLISKQQIVYTEEGDEDALDYQRTWLKEIVLLLNSLGNKKSSYSRDVLHLLLRVGQVGLSNSNLAEEYDKIQNELQKYYCIRSENGDVCYGPFMELSLDCQEISISCLFYFSSLKQQLVASLALCCLSHSLAPSIVFRIIEVLHSSYKAGHIQLADHISFFITLVSQYEVIPDIPHPDMKALPSNIATFRSVTGVICSLLPQLGDQTLALQIVEEIILDLIACKLPLENTCGLMRMLVLVDSKPTRLSEKSIILLSDILLGYLIDVALLFPEDEKCTFSNDILAWRYYLLPCFVLMDRCTSFLKHLVDKMGSLTVESCELPFLRDMGVSQDHPRKIKAIVSVFSMMCKDVKMRGVLSSYKADIDDILRRILVIQTSTVLKMSIEQQHKVQHAVERLQVVISDISSIS